MKGWGSPDDYTHTFWNHQITTRIEYTRAISTTTICNENRKDPSHSSVKSPKENTTMSNYTTKNVLIAISKAIEVMEQPKANGKNLNFGNVYIELSDIMKAVKPSLRECGLHLIKNTEDDIENSRIGVQLTVIHLESGELIEFKTVWRYYSKKNPQSQASAETYATRQAICNIFLIAVDKDDDGNGASSDPTPKKKNTQPSEPNAEHRSAQIRFITMCKKKGISDELRKAITKEVTHFTDSTKDLTEKQILQLHDIVESKSLETITEWFQKKCS